MRADGGSVLDHMVREGSPGLFHAAGLQVPKPKGQVSLIHHHLVSGHRFCLPALSPGSEPTLWRVPFGWRLKSADPLMGNAEHQSGSGQTWEWVNMLSEGFDLPTGGAMGSERRVAHELRAISG